MTTHALQKHIRRELSSHRKVLIRREWSSHHNIYIYVENDHLIVIRSYVGNDRPIVNTYVWGNDCRITIYIYMYVRNDLVTYLLLIGIFIHLILNLNFFPFLTLPFALCFLTLFKLTTF